MKVILFADTESIMFEKYSKKNYIYNNYLENIGIGNDYEIIVLGSLKSINLPKVVFITEPSKLKNLIQADDIVVIFTKDIFLHETIDVDYFSNKQRGIMLGSSGIIITKGHLVIDGHLDSIDIDTYTDRTIDINFSDIGKTDLNKIRAEYAKENKYDSYIHCPHASYPAQLLYNYLAFPITRYLIDKRISPNQVSFISLLLTLVGLFFIISMNQTLLYLGIALLHIGFVFDCVDGALARIRNAGTFSGGFLDSSFDSIKISLLMLSVGYYLYSKEGTLEVLMLMLSLFCIKYIIATTFTTAIAISNRTKESLTSSSDFLPKSKLLERIFILLNMKSYQANLTNDFLIIIFSIGLLFNISITIIWLLIVFYIIQFFVFMVTTFKKFQSKNLPHML